MSVRIPYAYLKQQTYLYRRNYPRELQPVLGQALKQSLRTGDARVAKKRATEINAKFEEIVTKARAGHVVEKPVLEKVAPVVFSPVVIVGRKTVKELGQTYLNKRSDELRPGGFKVVRFSVNLFLSAYGSRTVGSINREDALDFTRKVARLGVHSGKSYRYRSYGLDQLIAISGAETISARTQRRTVGQVSHFLDWAVYEGHVTSNPFKTVRVEAKGKNRSYSALTDEEVRRLVAADDPVIGDLLRFCLLTGMRSGEAAGLVRDNLVWKGNLGWFVWVRPNAVRTLKTDAAERFIPLHSDLTPILARLPAQGRLFPRLTVNMVTKRFIALRTSLGIVRPGAVFHSTRKWFVTQCERAGVPEHFTASIVGHQSARSENRMTYGIYSAGISDEQKREIIEKVGLPVAR
ncbi:tyrosine-type recombinase/integrase [Tabrizicola sp. J26]|uniref:DUF6538 domain-containing protein n=1 Tax=Alitabrizicola rongguiensis TaxID=2909234 RepID=UPI001F45116B|nr:DUF6538 domain-containing protein [Tabrizicola rongguiensis]MCF1711161.1 tyrosine-type recombinase/integrase [Tabrizicola rongguiensis]